MQTTAWPLAGLILASVMIADASAAFERPFPLVTVTGEGKVTAKPDIVQATAGVSSEGKTPPEASEANSTAMASVIAALKAAGIAETDIRTARFSIAPLYAQRERGAPRIAGYRVVNHVRATVRDIAALGGVLDKLTAAGATDITAIEFMVENSTELLDNARLAAFAEARRKAELFARAAGTQLGRAVTITEEDAMPPPPRPYRALSAATSAASATPIEPGEETLRARVTVSFELAQ